ncbi:MAG: hypothetical protein ACYTGZ_19180 [Planctomycetota bacterium]|jgi:hypothetical protein
MFSFGAWIDSGPQADSQARRAASHQQSQATERERCFYCGHPIPLDPFA